MKQQKTIFTLMFAAVLATMSVLSFAAAPKQETAGQYIDDSVVTTKIKAAIFNEPTLKSAEINVETYKGVVQLSGFVRSEADIEKAVEVARSIKGVNSVNNVMSVKGSK